jgi:hypothetical protein
LGERFVYELEVLMGYEKILDSKGIQTFERRKSKRKQGILWSEKRRCAS